MTPPCHPPPDARTKMVFRRWAFLKFPLPLFFCSLNPFHLGESGLPFRSHKTLCDSERGLDTSIAASPLRHIHFGFSCLFATGSQASRLASDLLFYLRMALNFRPSRFHLLSAGIVGRRYHTSQKLPVCFLQPFVQSMHRGARARGK